jgi:DNA-binding Lrp family transcriptional regulator
MSGEYDITSKFNREYSLVSRKIMRLISEDSRITVAEIAKKVGLSRPTVKLKLSAMQKELGITYTLELDERALGFTSPHLIAVKFKRKPDYDKITALLLKSYIPQVAFSTSGSYDLVIYANAFSTSDYAHWDKSMSILLGEYGAEWQPSEVVHRQLGFFPIRSNVLDRARIDDKYKEMLKLLNENAKLSFQQLSKALNIHFNTVKYNYNKLIKLGYIKRPTITINPPKNLSIMTFFSNYTPVKGYESSSATARLAFMNDDSDPLISRYLICAPLIGRHDFFTTGVFDSFNAAYNADILYHKRIFLKHHIKILYAELNKLLLGRLPIRSVNTKNEYNKIIWEPDFGK